MDIKLNKMGKVTKVIIVIVVALVAIYFLSPYYVQKALIYQKVGIDDYPIFSNRTVEAGNFQEWKVADDYNTVEISESYRATLEEYKSIGFLVVQNNEIKYEEYWDGYDKNSLTNSFSAVKSIISLLVGCALDDGSISSLDDKINKYFPEIDGEFDDELTVKDVLNMSSGLNWDESYGSLFSTTTEAYYGNDLPALILRLDVVEEPGKEFKYLSGNTQLLGMLIKRATGVELSEYASDKLWKPIGAKNDALWCLDNEDGLEKAYCCFNSNVRDFARIGQLVLDSGMWNGNQVVPKDYIIESTSAANYLSVPGSNEKADFYGYQWWIMNVDNHKVVYARGILGQYIFIIPELDAVIVRLGHIRSDEKINHHPKCAYTYLKAGFEILEK